MTGSLGTNNNTIKKLNVANGSTTNIASNLNVKDVEGFNGTSLLVSEHGSTVKVYDSTNGNVIGDYDIGSETSINIRSWDPDFEKFVHGGNSKFCITWYTDDVTQCRNIPAGSQLSDFYWANQYTLYGRLKTSDNKYYIAIIKVSNASLSITNYKLLHLNASNPGTNLLAVDSSPESQTKILMSDGTQIREYNIGTYATSDINLLSSIPSVTLEIGPLDSRQNGGGLGNNKHGWHENDFYRFQQSNPGHLQFRSSSDSSVWRDTHHTDPEVFHDKIIGNGGKSVTDWGCISRSSSSWRCNLWAIALSNGELVVIDELNYFDEPYGSNNLNTKRFQVDSTTFYLAGGKQR